ncbi:MAG: hypothetical protein CVT49_10185 [candidate division Zixibacteria bacterium HGW-Zixibacteria-1]|nr:MAG: hypothetical protein CVT49_10185 [candidate division Zixibacteria bacterium HGW-Zixibacteria-1]
MLRIARIDGYRLAQYPKEFYYKKPLGKLELLLKYSPIAFSILALFEGCDLDCSSKTGMRLNRVGVMGPPPMAPEFITENEAREVINHIFEEENIKLEPDFEINFVLSNGDSRRLVLDGFDSRLDVGYEYLGIEDPGEIDYQVRAELTGPKRTERPNILIIDPQSKSEDYQMKIKQTVESFIDSLKSEGII